MRLIVALLCISASLSGPSVKKPDAFYLEASKLFVSEAREFDSRISNRENKLNGLAHPFVVELDSGCDADCHSKLLKFFNPAKYRIYDSHHSTLFASLDDIERFHAAHPKVLANFAAIHPEMKVHKKIRDLSKLANGCYPSVLQTKSTAAADELGLKAPEHRIRVELIPMEIDELEEFLAFTQKLEKKNKNQFSFEFSLAQKHTRSMVGFLVSSRCEKISTFVNALAQRREVKWMEIDYPCKVHNRWSRGICDVANADYTPLTSEGILGDDEIVGVSDTGLDLTSCYFYDSNFNSSFPYYYQYDTSQQVLNPTHRKVVQYVAYKDNRDDSEAHGTHVAGSIVGEADITIGSFKLYNGMAYNAKVAFFDIGLPNGAGSVVPPADIEGSLLEVLYPSGARIFSNSWGNGNNDYDSLALSVDSFMWYHPEALVLFSAGNDGNKGRHNVGSPSVNKNGLCVGASLNNYDSWRANTLDPKADSRHDINSMAFFSSQGPTSNNRLKPDIVAPGWYVQSAAGVANGSEYHCTIKQLSGTSQATPTAAGFAVKIRQYYRKGYYPSGNANVNDSFMPSGALIKATLIHSAQPLQYLVNVSRITDLSGYPNYIQGYGRIQMNKVLNFGASTTNPINMFVVGAVNDTYPHYAEISSGSLTKTFTFQTDSASSQAAIRITMCYTDYPSGSGSSGALVNTLSLSVSDGHGNSFTPYVGADIVKSVAQVIDIASSSVRASSTYTVTVSATTVSQTQPFALVITGGLTYLNITAAATYGPQHHSAQYISHDAFVDIIGLSILVVIIFLIIFCFTRLVHKSRKLTYDPDEVDNTPGIMGAVARIRHAALEKQRRGLHNMGPPTNNNNRQSSPRAGNNRGGSSPRGGGSTLRESWDRWKPAALKSSPRSGSSPRHASPRHASPRSHRRSGGSSGGNNSGYRSSGGNGGYYQDYEYNPADFQ